MSYNDGIEGMSATFATTRRPTRIPFEGSSFFFLVSSMWLYIIIFGKSMLCRCLIDSLSCWIISGCVQRGGERSDVSGVRVCVYVCFRVSGIETSGDFMLLHACFTHAHRCTHADPATLTHISVFAHTKVSHLLVHNPVWRREAKHRCKLCIRAQNFQIFGAHYCGSLLVFLDQYQGPIIAPRSTQPMHQLD